MNQLTNEEFIDFLMSFKDKYYLPISQISKSGTEKANSVSEFDMKMLSFDDICANSKKLSVNLPTSVDAIHWKVDENNNFILYIIEFKYHNLDEDKIYKKLVQVHNSLKKKNKITFEYSDEKIISDSILNKFSDVKNHFVDSVELSLILKPIESIFVDLPILYGEYCDNNPDVDKKDIKSFLNKISIKLFVFVNTYSRNYQRERYESELIADRLNNYYTRLKNAEVINNYEIKPGFQFEDFLKNENLI